MARLIEELKKLPGVGGKTAQRFAFHILRSSDEDAELLADSIRQLKASLHLCSVCNNITDVDPCVYCTSPTRNQRLVCVVEEPTNIAAIEKTAKLQRRVSRAARHALAAARRRSRAAAHRQPGAPRRVGRRRRVDPRHQSHRRRRSHRDLYLAPVEVVRRSKVTRIATGVPAGSDIEYADEVTMQKAMEGRREL